MTGKIEKGNQMNDHMKAAANQPMPPMFDAQAPLAGLTGLFDEMQALMALMPAVTMDRNMPLSTDEETEAMFDNMPV